MWKVRDLTNQVASYSTFSISSEFLERGIPPSCRYITVPSLWSPWLNRFLAQTPHKNGNVYIAVIYIYIYINASCKYVYIHFNLIYTIDMHIATRLYAVSINTYTHIDIAMLIRITHQTKKPFERILFATSTSRHSLQWFRWCFKNTLDTSGIKSVTFARAM